MQFGVVPSASGPLALKLHRQAVDNRRKERLEAKRRAEQAALEQKAREQGLFFQSAEGRRRDRLERWRWLQVEGRVSLNSGASAGDGRAIMREVADRHGIKFDDLKSAGRKKAIAAIRHEAYYLVTRDTALSYPQIGKLFGGRDHTTIMHGAAMHAERNGLPPARTPQQRGDNERQTHCAPGT